MSEIKLGEVQELIIVKQVEFGVYLAADQENQEERVLLPGKQVPNDASIGDTIKVFIYRDSKDRLIATVNTPAMTLGKIAILKVAQVGKIGAFLDWGLEKELLLPFREQTCRLREGDECLVALYIDKSRRLCATMKVYLYLRTDSPYKRDDKVQGRVYEVSQEFGAFIAVDNQYSGLIPRKEMYGELHPGETITARVTSVKPDGKLDLSIREKAHLQIETDAEKILAAINNKGGYLEFTDKADPVKIKEEMQMSKNEFKRAVGKLLKERKIEILPDRIVGMMHSGEK